MSLTKFPDFEILDCTVRDGGYINNWDFECNLVREIYRTLSKSGVDYMEIGYRGSERYFSKDEYGIWRFTHEEAIRGIVSDIKGTKLSLMADYGKVEISDFCEAKESAVEFVRLAVHKDNLKGAIWLLEKIKQKGYKVSLNAMGYTNYSEKECAYLIDLLKASDIDYIYVVDSYGSLYPYQIEPLLKPLLQIPNIKVGFHSHNSLQMAFANTLEAIRCGANMVDCTIYGMGRAAGNLPTEIIVSFLEGERKDKYNSIPLLNIIDRYFVDMQKENKWGYQLPYLLSGICQCHPAYAKALVDMHEYTIADIRKAMDYIRTQEPIGFSKQLLNDIIAKGIIGSGGPAVNNDLAGKGKFFKIDVLPKINYKDRHKEKDFLILANGPSLNEYKDKIDKFILKHDPIVIGANYLGVLFKPHYHAFNNKRRFISYIDTVSPESKLLIGQNIPDEMISEYTKRYYEKMYYLDVLNNDFGIQDGIITTNCRTIAILLLGIAIVMGARRIFAVGMDGYLDVMAGNTFHFYNEKDEHEDQDMIIERHRWCQKFIEQIDAYLVERGKEGIHILTPTTYRSFYKGIENYI